MLIIIRGGKCEDFLTRIMDLLGSVKFKFNQNVIVTRSEIMILKTLTKFSKEYKTNLKETLIFGLLKHLTT